MPRILKSSWITEYSEAFSKISEAPGPYNIWAAISAIGTVMKNNTFYKRGTFVIYPNNYIILVGPPGVGKGTAIRPVYDIVEELNLANIIPDRITAPRIIKIIETGTPATRIINGIPTVTTDSTAVLMALELPVLISSSDWMLPFLCQAWDQENYKYDTKNMGTNIIKGMCTSLIGGCVPDYIRKLNKDITAAVSGGFTARAIFVYADKPGQKIMWPQPMDATPAGRKLLQDLKEDLKTIAQLRGEFKFTTDGALAMQKFYLPFAAKDDDSDVVQYFKSRMLVHVIKVAMIFSASQKDNLLIDFHDVTNSVTCLRHVAFNLDKAFRGVGDSDIAEGTARVQGYMEKKMMVTKAEVLKNLHRHISPESLDRIMGMLVTTGFCNTRVVNNILFYEVKNSRPTFQTSLSSLT